MKSRITQNAVLIRLSFSKAGNARKGDMGQVETDGDKSRLRLVKQLFDCQEYKAIATLDGEIRTWIMARAIQCDAGFSGVALLPLALLDDAEKYLADATEKRAALVTAFLAVYDSQRDAARIAFNGQFREEDYPPQDTIAAQFGIRWSYVTFETPENLPAEIAEREKGKLEAKFLDIENDITTALRESFAALLAHLAERLTPAADGKKKIFRDSAVTNLTDFLTLFSARNITNDAALAELADKAKAMIVATDPNALRDNRTIRERTLTTTAEIKAQVDKLIETSPRRRFNLNDE